MKRTGILIIVACVLIIGGMALFFSTMSPNNWDFSVLNTVQLETNEYTVDEAFSGISVQTETAGITFLPSADGNTKVVCYEETNGKHTVSVQNGILTILRKPNRGWAQYVGIRFDTPKITVYLPEGIYGDLSVITTTALIHVPGDFSFQNIKISSTTGDIEVFACAEDSINLHTNTGKIQLEQVRAAAVALSATTGSIIGSDITCEGAFSANLSTGSLTVQNVTCSDFSSTGSTGRSVFENLIASGRITVKKSTGDVTFQDCDAAEITVTTTTGDVSGTFLTPKVYITSTSTGQVDVPKSTEGGICNITTSTGSIKFN